MRGSRTVPAAFKKSAMALGAAPFPTAATGRLLGLDVGDWATVLLGLVMLGLLLALV
jgi:hypothetical protein